MSAVDERPAGYLPMCADAICDGEEHYNGHRDPVTNEDVVTGPCPRWEAQAGTARVAVLLAVAIVGPLLGLALGVIVLALQPVVCHINGGPASGITYCVEQVQR